MIHVCSLTLSLANCCMSTLLPPHTITSRGPRGAWRRPGKETRHQRHLLFATALVPLCLSFCLRRNMERSFSLRKLEISSEKDKSSAFQFNLTSCFFCSGDGGLTFILQSLYEAAVDGCQRCSARHLHQHTLVICAHKNTLDLSPFRLGTELLSSSHAISSHPGMLGRRAEPADQSPAPR